MGMEWIGWPDHEQAGRIEIEISLLASRKYLYV